MEDGRTTNLPRFMLWVDGVGGFLVTLADCVTLGQPGGPRPADIPILGDLSSRHARIHRDGEGYLIDAIHEVRLNGRPVTGLAPLEDGTRIALGSVVRMVFHRPHALSATARLDFESHHRTQPSADAILLMADSCVLGPRRHSHVVCRNWPDELILYRHDDDLYCRANGVLHIDGVAYDRRGILTRNSHVTFDQCALCLEDLGSGGSRGTG